MPLETLAPSKHRYASYSTLGKLANIVHEVSDLHGVDLGHLKSYVAGEMMPFEQCPSGKAA
jgi:hypothetical protein